MFQFYFKNCSKLIVTQSSARSVFLFLCKSTGTNFDTENFMFSYSDKMNLLWIFSTHSFSRSQFTIGCTFLKAKHSFKDSTSHMHSHLYCCIIIIVFSNLLYLEFRLRSDVAKSLRFHYNFFGSVFFVRMIGKN